MCPHWLLLRVICLLILPIQEFQDNFYAWIAIAAIIIWVATCLLLAFGEWGDGMKKLLNILFWMSLALSGATAVPVIFGSGAVF